MGYIRDNEDYYIKSGFSPINAKIQVELDKAEIDYGVCNPMKVKLAHEAEAEILEKIMEKGGL